LQHAHLDLDYLRSAAHFHLSSFFLLRALRPTLPKLFLQMKQAGLTTSLDTNDDPENLWADDVMAVLKSVDVFLPNEQEAYKLTGTGDLDSALDALSRSFPSLSSSAERKAPSPNEAKTAFMLLRSPFSR